MDKLYIVMPAYNESANINSVVKEWYQIVLDYGVDSRLVVVNDGSRDDTLKILNSLKEIYDRLIVIDKENGGHGSAVIRGYEYAIKEGADYVFQTDSDGQTNPAEFKGFWSNRKTYDMVIGYRKHRGDGLMRRFVTRVLRLVIRLIFGVWVKDANTPYRLMKSDALASALEYLPENYNIPNVIISVYLTKKGSILYRNISFKPRQGGKNSINIRRIFKWGFNAVKDFREINKKMSR